MSSQDAKKKFDRLLKYDLELGVKKFQRKAAEQRVKFAKIKTDRAARKFEYALKAKKWKPNDKEFKRKRKAKAVFAQIKDESRRIIQKSSRASKYYFLREEEIEPKLVDSSLKKAWRKYSLPVDGSDLPTYLLKARRAVVNLISPTYSDQYNFQLRANAIMIKMEGGTQKVEEFGFPSKSLTVRSLGNAEEQYNKAILDLTNKFADWGILGSGWQWVAWKSFEVYITPYDPLTGFSKKKGSRYIELPDFVKNKQVVINVKNEDEKCFKWSLLSALFHDKIKDHPERVSHYKKLTRDQIFKKLGSPSHLDPEKSIFEDLEYPVSIDQIERFEKKTKISVNVFGYKSKVYVIYESKIGNYINEDEGEKPTYEVDLLLIDDGPNSHYCWIKKFNSLMRHRTGNQQHYCRRCIRSFKHPYSLIKHQEKCRYDGTCIRNFPKPGSTKKFDNIHKQHRVPFVIYADFESILKKYYFRLSEIDENTDRATRIEILGEVINHGGEKTTRTQYHEPCGYGLYLVGLDGFKIEGIQNPIIYRGNDPQETMDHFAKDLMKMKEYADNIYNNPLKMDLDSFDREAHRAATDCHICKKPLLVDSYDKPTDMTMQVDDRVADHCHITGKYRGAAHSDCNLQYRSKHGNHKVKIPVIFHNCRGYDSHLILGNFSNKRYGDVSIGCIPNNMQKYISFNIDNLIFLDSMQYFIGLADTSLAGLVETLAKSGNHMFKHTNAYFDNIETNPNNCTEMLLKKGIYFYEYMDTFTKFSETKLPPIEKFYSSLSESTITEAEYRHAHEVWEKFNCKTLGDYHDLYLATDILLLADVFENLRNMCLEYFGLDPCNYFTTAGIAGDAMYKISGAEIDLISDEEQYDFIMRGIRGGISMISHRFARANNPCMGKQYDPNIDTSHIFYVDANSLYPSAMIQPLPKGNFKWKYPIENVDKHMAQLPELNEHQQARSNNVAKAWEKRILEWKHDAQKGYIFEVDLEYPVQLHDLHNDYPLCPETMIPPDTTFNEQFRKSFGIKHADKTMKLVPNLNDKKNYVVHYRYLKFCLEQGMKLKRVYRVLEFDQSPWLKSYIDFCVEKRAEASKAGNKVLQDFFKLMMNSAYGKTMENVEKRTEVKLAKNKEILTRWTSKTKRYDGNSRKFNEDLTAVEMTKAEVTLDRPMYVGMTILDLSKLIMAEFHYNTMMKIYGPERCRLLFTDTDSLCYHIKTEDLNIDLESYKDIFDNSEFPKDHPRYDATNCKQLMKFKDEACGSQFIEFVGLRPKLYSLLKLEEGKTIPTEKKIAKGFAKYAIKKTLNHQMYKETLETCGRMEHTMNTLRSRDHVIATTSIRKTSLSANDNKRIILDDGISSYAHGHFKSAPWLSVLPKSSSNEPQAAA